MEELNIIRKVVWSYVRSNPGMEFDDLFSEACLAYMEVAACYDPERGKKSTFVWKVVSNNMNTLIKGRNIHRECPTDREAMETLLEGRDEVENQGEMSPEQIFLTRESWKELVMKLSPEAQTIVSLVTKGNLYFRTDKPRESRGRIAKELRKRGWSHGMIWGTFREIKGVLSQ